MVDRIELKKGDTVRCTESVVMDTDMGEVAYIKGRLYPCMEDGCIQDEQGDMYHEWPLGEDFYRFFEPISIRDLGIGFPGELLKKDQGQKNDSDKLPYFTVLFKQFPNAIRELVRCSNAGHQKYSETDKDWMNFSRVENADTRYKNAGLRHMLESGPVEDMSEYGGMSHEGAVVWNFMADLEIKLRNEN